MDKKALTQALLGKLRSEQDALLGTIRENEKSAAEAPSAMQSHSDTSKFQFGKLAEEDMKRAGILGEVIDSLISLQDKENESADIGALVSLQGPDGISYFYITPEGGGGREILLDGVKVATVSPGSPVGSAILGKKIGNDAVVRYPAGSKTFKITGMQ